MMEDQDGV